VPQCPVRTLSVVGSGDAVAGWSGSSGRTLIMALMIVTMPFTMAMKQLVMAATTLSNWRIDWSVSAEGAVAGWM